MYWCKHVALVRVSYWSIEILPLSFWSIMIVLRSHHLKVGYKISFDQLIKCSLFICRVDWLSSFPIILVPFIKVGIIPCTRGWSFENILHGIFVLSASASFIEKFFVARVEFTIVLWWCDMSPVVPGWCIPRFRFINSISLKFLHLPFLESIHFYFIS